MDYGVARVQVHVKAPVTQRESLERKQQDEATRQIVDEVDSVGLNATLPVVPIHPDYFI